MTNEDADRLRTQVQSLTWNQLVALWKWITFEMIARGPYANHNDG